MKKHLPFLMALPQALPIKKIFVTLLVFTVLSCEQEVDVTPKKGLLQMQIKSKMASTSGRLSQDFNPASILVTIKNAAGEIVYANEELTVYSFNENYIAEALELFVGEFELTEFLVLDESKNVIAAAPMENSEYADLVSDALPISLTIAEGISTLTSVEAVAVTDETSPENFGYASFKINIINPPQIKLNFKASATGTMGYDSVFVTFEAGSATIKKSLEVISPVEAIGSIPFEELSTSTLWTVKVAAYHESVDDVAEIIQVNESVATTELTISNNVSEIVIDQGSLFVKQGATTAEQKNLSWENQAHISDVTGYFHLIVNHDACTPYFNYEVKKSGVDYVYYDKITYSTAADGSNHINYETRNNDLYNPAKGAYVDQVTFAGICPVPKDQDRYFADIFFYIEDDAVAYECFLIWTFDETPIDPAGNTSIGRVVVHDPNG